MNELISLYWPKCPSYATIMILSCSNEGIRIHSPLRIRLSSKEYSCQICKNGVDILSDFLGYYSLLNSLMILFVILFSRLLASISLTLTGLHEELITA